MCPGVLCGNGLHVQSKVALNSLTLCRCKPARANAKTLPELIHGTDTSLEVVLLKPKTPSQSSKNMKLVSPLSPFPVTPFLSTSTKLKVHGILAAEFLNRFIGQVTPFGIRPPPNWEQLKFVQLMKSRWIPSLDQVTPFDPFGNS